MAKKEQQEPKKRRPYGTGPYAKKSKALTGLQPTPVLEYKKGEAPKVKASSTFIFLTKKQVDAGTMVKQKPQFDPIEFFKTLPIGDLKINDSLLVPQIDPATGKEHRYFNTTKLKDYIDKFNKFINADMEFNISSFIHEEKGGERIFGRLITRAK